MLYFAASWLKLVSYKHDVWLSNEKYGLPDRLWCIRILSVCFVLDSVVFTSCLLEQEPGGAGAESVAQSPAGAVKSKVPHSDPDHLYLSLL